jgi:N6-L-threonylcarbamoyladenine synthase
MKDHPMTRALTVLGLESSCDDTAAAVVERDRDGALRILSNVVVGQGDLHAAFGGVVPEIAARAHAEKIDHCVEQALSQSDLTLEHIDAIAVTAGPGLIGGVLSGVMCAKGIAAATGKPLIGVNHLAGHALTPRLTDDLPFPYLMLLVSGGHCQFLVVRSASDFLRLGGTIDDAPGEAFDKTARLLGLPQPGGPEVERAAKRGNPKRYTFPRPMLNKRGCDLSFSGLKTAVLRARNEVMTDGTLTQTDMQDLCAGFQSAVSDVLAEKTRRAIALYLQDAPAVPALAVAGGVAANASIRTALEQIADENGLAFTAPPLALCTDNAAMIASAGLELFQTGAQDDLTLSARPRWPLDTSSAPMLGSGKKGAKA